MRSPICVMSTVATLAMLGSSACGALPGLFATPTPTATLTPLPTFTPLPTITSTPAPTLTRTPSGSPTPTTQPKIVAAKRADVVGRWSSPLSDQTIRIEFRPDGSFDLDVVEILNRPGDVYHVQEGIFRFTGGNLILDADYCHTYQLVAGVYAYFHCQGTFKVYSTYRGETPVVLSFVRVTDPFLERGTWFDGRNFGPAEQ